MLLREATITVVDFETTGVVGTLPDEPWQIGLARVEKGHLCPDHNFCTLLHVAGRPFNPFAPGRHAELRDQITAAPRLSGLWNELGPRLSGVLAAHNVATERKLLQSAFPLHPLGPWIDTLRLIRIAYPRLASHRLEDILRSLRLEESARRFAPGLGPHDALYDAVGCALLLEHLLSLESWRDVPLERILSPSPD